MLTISILLPAVCRAQQFIGLNTSTYAAINHVPANPAWVANAKSGTEIMLFSANGLAGNNAYSISKKYVFSGFGKSDPNEEVYYKDLQRYQKHMWANIEMNGPAISFQYKDEHYIGAFTRVRQIVRGGNIASTQLQLFGEETPESYYGAPVGFNNAGFSTHTFAEVGFSYGRILRNDYYNIIRAGVSVKYLMGFVAGSIYTNELDYTRENGDSLSLNGDLTMLYTHNVGSFVDNNPQNDLTSWFQRAGRWGLGLDIGAQYEYHPTGNPNMATPYLFSIAASITDLGSIGYIADTGSGSYELSLNNLDTSRIKKLSYEGINDYMMRMESDTLTGISNKVQKFRAGLPTALRLNADYNASDKLNFAINILLNLRGNGGDFYRPAYVNYINMTPTFGGNNVKVGLPFTIMGYQTFAIGAIVRIGPFYVGSTSVLSMLLYKNIRNIDGYAGLVWKFKKDEYKYK